MYDSSHQLARPWRLIVLDRDPDDPKWLVCHVEAVRPAALDATGQYTDWTQVTGWARDHVDADVRLLPLAGARAWLLEEAGS